MSFFPPGLDGVMGNSSAGNNTDLKLDTSPGKEDGVIGVMDAEGVTRVKGVA